MDILTETIQNFILSYSPLIGAVLPVIQNAINPYIKTRVIGYIEITAQSQKVFLIYLLSFLVTFFSIYIVGGTTEDFVVNLAQVFTLSQFTYYTIFKQ